MCEVLSAPNRSEIEKMGRSEANGVGTASKKKITPDQIKKIGSIGNGCSGSSERSPLLSSSSDDNDPKDTCHLTYIIFYLHGIGHLLPWNFFITATLYFEAKFKCPTNSTSHCRGFDGDFENFFGVAAMLPIVVMGAVNIWLQSKLHYKYRIYMALIIMAIFFALTLGFVAVPTSHWTDGFFSLTLFTVLTLNVASSMFQSSTFGFAGVFPFKYTSVVLSGQAMAGIFAAVASLITLAAVSNNPINSAYGYFSVALIVILFCLLSFVVMLKLPFVHHHLEKTSVRNQKAKQQSAVKASLNVKVLDVSPPYWTIFKQIWVHAVSVFMVFGTTLSLFPAVISIIESSVPNPKASHWTDTYFSTLVCFLIFNVSDFVGRYITHWLSLGNHRFILLVSSFLRLVLIPLFLLCNVQLTGKTRAIPIVFNNDAYPVVFNTILGLTNGYFGSLAMIFGPQQVIPDHRETAATIMAFFLSFGLLIGSSTSFIWTHLVIVKP